MQSPKPSLDQTPLPVCIRGRMPIKQPRQPRLRHKPRLSLDRGRGIIRHKAAIATNTECSDGLVINALFRRGARQVPVIEDAVLAASALPALARFRAGPERAAVDREAEEELVGWDGVPEDVGYGGGAGSRGARGRAQGSVVAGFAGPGAGEVVGHEIEEVEGAGGAGEVDVAEGPFAGWEAGCEDVAGGGEGGAEAGEEVDVV
jgi:hypothetical protein